MYYKQDWREHLPLDPDLHVGLRGHTRRPPLLRQLNSYHRSEELRCPPCALTTSSLPPPQSQLWFPGCHGTQRYPPGYCCAPMQSGSSGLGCKSLCNWGALTEPQQTTTTAAHSIHVLCCTGILLHGLHVWEVLNSQRNGFLQIRAVIWCCISWTWRPRWPSTEVEKTCTCNSSTILVCGDW